MGGVTASRVGFKASCRQQHAKACRRTFINVSPAIISSQHAAAVVHSQNRFIHVSVLPTPNPKSKKFVPEGREVIAAEDAGEKEGIHWSFRKGVHDLEEVQQGAPLAADLLMLDEVDEVMYTCNSVVVLVKHSAQWLTLDETVIEMVSEAYDHDNPFAVVGDIEIAKKVGGVGSAVQWEEDSLEAEIEEILEDYVRPFVKEDGGDIYLVGANEDTGVVQVQMVGACSGCPSSEETLHVRVEQMLKFYLPEITDVERVEDEAITAEHEANQEPTISIDEAMDRLMEEGMAGSVDYDAEEEKSKTS